MALPQRCVTAGVKSAARRRVQRARDIPGERFKFAPVIRVRRSAQRLTLEAEVSLQPTSLVRSVQLGLSAVVEAADGGLSYWALKHPPGKPDFHHVDAFALQLDFS